MLVSQPVYSTNFHAKSIAPVIEGTTDALSNTLHQTKRPCLSVPADLLRYLNIYRFEPRAVLIKMINYILEKDEITLDDKDLFQKAFKNAFDIIHTDENKLGSGVGYSVYTINEKYALRCPNKVDKTKIGNVKSSLCIPINRFNNLETFRGGALMTFGEYGSFSILDNIGKHIPAGVPDKIHADDAYHYYVSEYLPAFAKVPQESYDAIVKDCAELNKSKSGIHYYAFDFFNPGNIVLNNNKLYWVDEITDTTAPNTLTQLLEMLLLKKSTKETIIGGYDQATADAQAIFRKIILASARSKLEIHNPKKNPDKIWKIALDNLKVEQSPSYVIHELKKIYSIGDTEARISRANTLLDTIFTAQENI